MNKCRFCGLPITSHRVVCTQCALNAKRYSTWEEWYDEDTCDNPPSEKEVEKAKRDLLEWTS